MSYEIKDRYTAKTLYVAKGAKDVREAVEAAAREGADLARADLARADLARANLARANLARAYLTDANLAGAYLAGAYLTDANLADANLADANLAHANLARANLARAYLARANLAGAYLAGAYLADADLARANLADANLADAYLARANLARAYLVGAKGLHPACVNDLLILLDQPGKIRAYKLVTKDGYGPINGGLRYVKGQTVEVKDADADPTRQCAAGINLATLPWCLRNWREGHRILVCEFTKADIAAIPIGDGKFRVSKAKVVREIPTQQIHEWLSLDGAGS